MILVDGEYSIESLEDFNDNLNFSENAVLNEYFASLQNILNFSSSFS